MGTRSRRLTCLLVAAAVLATAAPALAQRGGGGGGGGGDMGFGMDPSRRTRLDILDDAFDFNGDQRRAVERLLDAAHEGAAGVRAQLMTTRDAISAAIIAGSDQATIDAAIAAYADQAAAMTGIEMQALADVLVALAPEQQGNGAAIRTAFFLMRGMFLEDRDWNAIPEYRGY